MATFDKAETKKAYQYDAKGVYVKDVELTWMNRSPISGTWQIPAYVTTVAPIDEKDGYKRIFDGTAWSYIDADDDSKEPEKTTTPTVTTLKERVQTLEAEKAALQELVDTLQKEKAAQADVDTLMQQVTETQAALNEIVLGGE